MLHLEANRFSGKRFAHLVGISGAGMKALAEVLIDRGWSVSGSDLNPDLRVNKKLRALGVQIFDWHQPEYIDTHHTVLIYSPAIPETNVERITAAKFNIPQLSYIDALADLISENFGIAIAGTHGKSTTTAMLGHILKVADQSPTVVCGAERVEDSRSGYSGTGSHTVVEACEYRGHFLKLKPQLLCLTCIEPDHFDCFPHFEDAINMYQAFIDQLPDNATLVTNLECETSQLLQRPSQLKYKTFSLFNHDATWCADHLRFQNNQQVCEIYHQNKHVLQLSLSQPGEHNVQNALAAIAVAHELGIELPVIQRGLESFKGLVRRYQRLPDQFEATVIDDYAHHPTEMSTTLKTVRKLHPGRRIVCVFQPHQVSRTQGLFIEFVDALALADEVYVLPVFGAREHREAELAPTSQALVNALERLNVSVRLIPALDQVWRTLETAIIPNDLIITLGAGDIARLHHERI